MAPSRVFADMEVKNVVLGGPTAAVCASYSEDIDVTVVDINEARIEAWNSSDLPISEPGLLELVLAHRTHEDDRKPSDTHRPITPTSDESDHVSIQRRRNLCFSTNVDDFLRRADVIFLCVDTPQQAGSEVHESAPDLTNLKKAIRRIGEVAERNFILVEKATVPCGTAKVAEKILHETLKPGVRFEILSNPEFLAEGRAVKDLEEPDRVLIGASRTPDGDDATQVLARLYEAWVPRDKIITSDTWSSELAKLCSNALLAQRVSSINSLSMICEHLGADVREISKAVKMDPRIGSHMLSASIGFGGSCFQKDVAHLVYLANSLGLSEVAQYWKSVLQINQLRKEDFADRINRQLETSRPGQALEVGILGFAFKAETNDARNSAAIDVVKRLMAHHHVRIYDPCVPERDILTCLGLDQAEVRSSLGRGSVTVCSSAYEACDSAHATAILTEWKEFGYGAVAAAPLQHTSRSYSGSSRSSRSSDSGLGWSLDRETLKTTLPLNWERIAKGMQSPKFLFDGRGVVDDAISEYGFKVQRIGKRSDDSLNAPLVGL